MRVLSRVVLPASTSRTLRQNFICLSDELRRVNVDSYDEGGWFRSATVRWTTDPRRPTRKMVVFAFRGFVMENGVYWNGRQVGIECDGRISWFPSAPKEAVAAYGDAKRTEGKDAVQIQMSDTIVARNLGTVAQFGRPDLRG
jgi:hypothetical protein